MSDKPTVSPSQHRTFKRCQRRWGFAKIEGLEDPAGEGAELGKVTHKYLEHYYRGEPLPHPQTKREKKARRLFKAFVDFYTWVPERPTVEDEFFVDRPLYQSHGFIDLTYRVEDLLVVHDHKTSSDPWKYGCTERTLPTDEQGIMYGHAVFEKYPDENELLLSWNYCNTRNAPQPFSVDVLVTREETYQRFDELIEPVSLQIVEARKAERAVMLDANYEACGDFGKPCPYAPYCPRPNRTLSYIMKSKEKPDVPAASVVERLKQLKSKTNSKGQKAPPKPEDIKKAKKAANSSGSNKILELKNRRGRDPAKVVEEYERQEAETGVAEPQVNAPEVDTGDDEALVEASKKTETEGLDKEALKRIAEEEAAKQGNKAPPLEGRVVMERLRDSDEEEISVSIRRANESGEYVQKKTLEELQSQGLITYYVSGQTAYVRMPDKTVRHAEAWLKCLAVAADRHDDRDEVIADACHFFEAYRALFG